MYVKNDIGKGVIILCLYVDDVLITDINECYVTEFKDDLMKEFEMTGLGIMTYFLDIEFHKSEKRLLTYQRRYAFEILKNFEIELFNVAITPAKPKLQLSKNKYEQDINPTQYRRLI